MKQKKYIDLSEAVQMTGKSDATLRRMLRQLSDDDRQKYVLKEGKKILIDKSFLMNVKPVEVAQHDSNSSGQVFDLFRQQLNEKDKQIRSLTDQNDRLLSDIRQKDADLKTTWSLLQQHQAELRQLKSAPTTSPNVWEKILVPVIVVALLSLSLYLLF